MLALLAWRQNANRMLADGHYAMNRACPLGVQNNAVTMRDSGMSGRELQQAIPPLRRPSAKRRVIQCESDVFCERCRLRAMPAPLAIVSLPLRLPTIFPRAAAQ